MIIKYVFPKCILNTFNIHYLIQYKNNYGLSNNIQYNIFICFDGNWNIPLVENGDAPQGRKRIPRDLHNYDILRNIG